ncbi:hypothetical protein JF50_18420 [Pseudoalteromonas luteoviolacea]|uniref:Uncharacterized protein n=1 Tax=Pseudoalteromonas luteoviolacea TaxID=43657 RepID=A0A0C1MH41_9GAMM|nr:hypothetical protein [Pseudoalteromonas luteoviolacea]KID56239.1 hypothetical protein JF50_18420 [Pseudoalteromonas luteoviolacea]
MTQEALTEERMSALLAVKDRFSCLEMQKNMIVRTDLRIATSNLYPQLSAKPALKLLLANIYYIPSSNVALTDDNTVTNFFESNGVPIDSETSVVMSKEFANYIVEGSAQQDSNDVISLVLANVGYRCAFSDLSDLEANENFDSLDADAPVLADVEEQARIGILVWQIAMNNALRTEIINLIAEGNEAALTDKLVSIKLDNDYGFVAQSTAETIANGLVVKKDIKYVASYIGKNMYKATW